MTFTILNETDILEKKLNVISLGWFNIIDFYVVNDCGG